MVEPSERKERAQATKKLNMLIAKQLKIPSLIFKELPHYPLYKKQKVQEVENETKRKSILAASAAMPDFQSQRFTSSSSYEISLFEGY